MSALIAQRSVALRPRSFETALAVLVLVLAGFTVLVVVNPALEPATLDVPLDVVVTTTASLVTAAMTLLAWGRFRAGGEASSLFRASAFAVLFALNGFVLATALLGVDGAFGASLDRPGQLPLLAVIVARLAAAVLLIVAGATALRPRPAPRNALFAMALPGMAVLAAIIAGAAVQASLPELIGPQAMQRLQAHPDRPLLGPDVSPWLFAGQLLVGIGFLTAAVLAYRVYRRDRLGVDACLAIGLVLAAFSQVHSALHPGSYTGVVTTGDGLRVAFYGSLLVAVVVEGWTDVRELRAAHATIRRLHEAELVRATHEERARLAREIHDGLAQDLWYAKLKQDRLMALAPANAEVRALGLEVADALDAALADARQAVMALRPSDGGSFGEVLLRYVEDFGDRFGILTDCSVEPMTAEPTPRAQAEVLRIVQEALNNVRKHADATVVQVTAHGVGHAIEVTVADNGRGFDPSRSDAGYGLHGMQERARIAGATLSVDSRPSDGTRVRVLVPVARTR